MFSAYTPTGYSILSVLIILILSFVFFIIKFIMRANKSARIIIENQKKNDKKITR